MGCFTISVWTRPGVTMNLSRCLDDAYLCIYIYMHTYTHMYIYIYTHMYLNTHIYIHQSNPFHHWKIAESFELSEIFHDSWNLQKPNLNSMGMGIFTYIHFPWNSSLASGIWDKICQVWRDVIELGYGAFFNNIGSSGQEVFLVCQNGRFVDQTLGRRKPLGGLEGWEDGKKIALWTKKMVLGKLIIYLTLLGFDRSFQGHFPHGGAVFVCFFGKM